ncbi:ABC transporter ATP-binding protein [Limnohabitans sp.]|uniref:ABC transporter ATP-binding protein n=1 Tax=Limnohabitans sp. TaxID=1907725 RepID=UPI00334153B9
MPTSMPETSASTAENTSSALLRLTNIESAYGPVKAIRGVSLEIKKGQIVTLLGSNGAGKTTLLKTISGIMDPVRGTVEFANQDITGLEASDRVKKGLSHVPEGREVFPMLTVYENLMMGAYTRNDRDAIARDLEQSYRYFPILKERETQVAGLLSGGQQQMLAIARALLADPQMILMDEPSLGLSPKLTKEIFQIIRMINRDSGRSILLVEQNARIALQTADFGYIMENGRIVMQDSCERLMQKDDIQEFYLGMKQEGVRAERRWKKKKTWR